MSKVVRLLGGAREDHSLVERDPGFVPAQGQGFVHSLGGGYRVAEQPRGLARLWYRGPLASERGDRLGTPAPVVRKRWRGSWQYFPHVIGAQGPNYGHAARFGSATFGFDGRSRLAGVAIDASQQIWQPVIMPACP